MAILKTILGTGGRGDDHKRAPEEIAGERIEAARKSWDRLERMSPGRNPSPP